MGTMQKATKETVPATRALVVLLAVCLLAACQTASLKTAASHDPANGIIAFRFVSNGPGPIAYQDPWDFAIIEETTTGETFTLTDVTDGLSRSALYIGSVPPGEYRLSSFAGTISNATGTPNDSFGRFAIEARRITYLGSIVEVVTGPRVDVLSRYRTSYLTYDPTPVAEGLPEVLQALYPGLSDVAMRPDSYLGWSEAHVPPVISQGLYDEVRDGSLGLLAPTELSDGRIAFGTLLGQIRFWHPEHGWSRVDLGVNRSVEAIVEIVPGALLVGGEMGMLRISPDMGKAWAQIRSPIPYGVVRDIHKMPDGGVYLTHYRDTRFTLLRSDINLNQWEPVQSFQFAAPGRFYGSTPQRLRTHRIGSLLLTTLPQSRLAVYDTETGRSEVRDMPGPVSRARASRDGRLRGIFERFIVWNPYLTADGGVTWESDTISRSTHMPAFRDESHGAALEMESGLTEGWTYLTRTKDGGSTWQRGPKMPNPFLTWIDYAADGSLLYATDQLGEFYYSRDGGETWKHDPVPSLMIDLIGF
ncbi:MAG: hypothetical protein R8L07_10555 [Alphaproteobacteria bacterium]|nr:hypothetical protein [Alphaproteobacteria bacterium]